MSTSKEFIDYILENIEDAGVVTFRKIFGEYAVIKSPSEKLKLGQIVQVTVKQIDLERKRISLTMKG